MWSETGVTCPPRPAVTARPSSRPSPRRRPTSPERRPEPRPRQTARPRVSQQRRWVAVQRLGRTRRDLGRTGEGGQDPWRRGPLPLAQVWGGTVSPLEWEGALWGSGDLYVIIASFLQNEGTKPILPLFQLCFIFLSFDWKLDPYYYFRRYREGF